MRHRHWLTGTLLCLALVNAPALAWEENDREAYNNKMALLQLLLDGAKQRADDTGDLQTLCMLMSIGNDVTLRYTQVNPTDWQIRNRLTSMRDDLTVCLALHDNPPSI